MAKDLGQSELTKGQQRYRIAEGYKPRPLDFTAETPDQAYSLAMSAMSDIFTAEGKKPTMFVRASDAYGSGPPLILMDWLAKSPEESERQCDSEPSSSENTAD